MLTSLAATQVPTYPENPAMQLSNIYLQKYWKISEAEWGDLVYHKL